MQISAIVLAAGEGLRFSSKVPKVLAKINSQPILIYSLLAFNRHPLIDEIILVVNAKNSRRIFNVIEKYRLPKIRKIVEGGRRRQDSVLNGLGALNEQTDLVLIHDAARPFIAKDTISAVIKEAKKVGAAIVGVPVKATIKKVKRKKPKGKSKFIVKETLNRNDLWEIQTPQVFKRQLLLKAFAKFGNTDVTDDAMLVEKFGANVSIVPGSCKNIKITTPEDLVIAKAISKINDK